MKRTFTLVSLLVALLVAGCGDGGFKDDGVPKAFTDQASTANAAAKAADGNYDKLTPEGKTQILKMANGDEKAARNLTMMMAHPPNEAMKKLHGGGN